MVKTWIKVAVGLYTEFFGNGVFANFWRVNTPKTPRWGLGLWGLCTTVIGEHSLQIGDVKTPWRQYIIFPPQQLQKVVEENSSTIGTVNGSRRAAWSLAANLTWMWLGCKAPLPPRFISVVLLPHHFQFVWGLFNINKLHLSYNANLYRNMAAYEINSNQNTGGLVDVTFIS